MAEISDLNFNPLRVCFISPKAYPLFDPSVESVFGGAEVDLYLLATELAKDERYQVSCITADYNQIVVQNIENVRVIKSFSFKENQLTGAIKIWNALKKANADIYILKTASAGVPLAAAFCKVHKKIFVYRTAHQRECDGTYLKEHPLLGRFFRYSLCTAKMIFTQNETDFQALNRTLLLDSIVIPNGHRIESSPFCQREHILWAGRSADFKKPARFMDIAENFPDEKFVMVCQKATRDTDYEQLRGRAGKIPNLEFHTRVPFKEIEKYFQKAKVLVNTSDSEGFPNTFIQAAKAATPILSYKVNPDNFLKKYNCGIAADTDINRLNDGLAQLLKENQYLEMGKNAKKYFHKNHDISEIIKKYKYYFSLFIDRNSEFPNG